MSFFKKILGALVEPNPDYVEPDIEKIRRERDDALDELQLIHDEYEVLKRELLRMMEAQEGLNIATAKLLEENKALKAMARINASFYNGGMMQ